MGSNHGHSTYKADGLPNWPMPAELLGPYNLVNETLALFSTNLAPLSRNIDGDS